MSIKIQFINKLTPGFLKSLILLSFFLKSTLVGSQPQWEHIQMPGMTLGEEPVYLQPTLRPGVLRIVLSGERKTNWEVILDYGPTGTVLLNQMTIEARTVRSQGSELVADVPLVAGATLKARANQDGLQVRILEAITLVGTFPEQMIDDSNVRLIDNSSSPDERRLADSLAKVELLGVGGEILGLCTAVRVSNGYWLTAAHCAYRDETRPEGPTIDKLRLQIGRGAGSAIGSEPFLGTAIASGINALPVTAQSVVRSRDLDYVLLEAPKDPGGATIVFDRAKPIQGERLELFQYWGGRIPPAAGFAISDGEPCKVQRRIGPDNDFSRPDLCPAAIQHGCSSEAGSSGAALVNKAGRLVAMHYAAGKTSTFNCALPIATLLSHLCQSNPSLARKVTSCP